MQVSIYSASVRLGNTGSKWKLNKWECMVSEKWREQRISTPRAICQLHSVIIAFSVSALSEQIIIVRSVPILCHNDLLMSHGIHDQSSDFRLSFNVATWFSGCVCCVCVYVCLCMYVLPKITFSNGTIVPFHNIFPLAVSSLNNCRTKYISSY